MSRVKRIENELEKLSIQELKEVREWLENFVEDRMEFTPEFESTIRESENEMKSGIRPRVEVEGTDKKAILLRPKH